MRKEDFTKGQTVYLTVIPKGDLSRWEGNDAITQGVVTSVGKRYIRVQANEFTCRFNTKDDFRQIDLLDTCYCEVHLSKEKAKQYIEFVTEIRDQKNVINDYFREVGNIDKLTLYEIDTIYSIVKVRKG